MNRGKRWPRGWKSAMHKAFDQQRVEEQAAVILDEEHGVRHDPGSHADLCPQCQATTAGGAS